MDRAEELNRRVAELKRNDVLIRRYADNVDQALKLVEGLVFDLHNTPSLFFARVGWQWRGGDGWAGEDTAAKAIVAAWIRFQEELGPIEKQLKPGWAESCPE